MNYINTRPLADIVHRIQDTSRISAVFNQINEPCGLGFKFELPVNVLALAMRINEREVHEKKYRPSADGQTFSWVFGEFKVFAWTLVYKCMINGLQIQELTLENVKELQEIFNSKSLCFLHYELRLLVSQKCGLADQNWTSKEMALFSDIIADQGRGQGKFNWRAVSFELFRASDARFFRNIYQCREKWFNHLNPWVRKGDWTPEEDARLFELIAEHGLRWSLISREMGKARTEHMVKNRFNRYCRQWDLARDTPVEVICKTFQEKVLKPYLRKQKNLEAADGLTLNVKGRQGYEFSPRGEPSSPRLRRRVLMEPSQIQHPHETKVKAVEPIYNEHARGPPPADLSHTQEPQKMGTASREGEAASEPKDVHAIKEEDCVKVEAEPPQPPQGDSGQGSKDCSVQAGRGGEWDYYPFMGVYCPRPSCF